MSKKILIIDDNEQDRKVMARFLTKAGFTEIFHAENGEEGVRKVGEVKPDLVVLDTMLPDIIGFEVCAKIKQNYPDIPVKVIMTTGGVDAVDALRAKKAGADDYCVKTSDCFPLLEAVAKIF